MKRKIITVDESLCNGCGQCITACAEGALKLVNGKAKLVKDLFCDGFGDCIGECPTGALKIEEREASAFDEAEVKRHLMQTQGPEAVRRMTEAAQRHEAKHTPPAGGCPGTRMQFRKPAGAAAPSPVAGGGAAGAAIRSDLDQWPVQLHLVQPGAPFFKDRELLVLSTCAPVASADVHWRFLRGRGVAVACPKLDRTEGYVEKLAEILREPSIPKVMVVRMEVPCCGGLSQIVRQAVAMSGRTDLVQEDVVVSLDGAIQATRPL